MPKITFNVKSDRIHDIVLNPGATVGDLRNILKDAYDVSDAYARVDRCVGGALVGSVENYVLKKGDCVQFVTREYDLPAERFIQEQEVKEHLTRGGGSVIVIRKDPSSAGSACTCRECRDGHATARPDTTPQGNKLKVGNLEIEVNGNKLTIVIGK